MVEFGKSWSLGFLLIMLFSVLGELAVAFDDSIFNRIGIDRNLVLIVLWTLPFMASFVSSYFSENIKYGQGCLI